MNFEVKFSESGQTLETEFDTTQPISGKDGESAYEIAINNGFEGTEQEWLDSLNGADGYSPVKGIDYFTQEDKNEMQQEATNAILPLVLQPTYENTDITMADKGLTYNRGIRAVKVVGSLLWIIDSGVYNIIDGFATTANHTVYQFNLPKEISNLLPNVNGVYGTTGTISYFPALAYENTTYTTFNCQSYLKRSAIGETEDTFQVVYTGLTAIKAGSGLCGFHLRMPILLV